MFCPGFGHFMMNKKIKGAVYLGVFGLAVYKLAAAGKIKSISDNFELQSSNSGLPGDLQVAIYFINGIQVSRQVYYERWNNEVVPVNEHNEKVKSRRKKFGFGLTMVYLVSIIDTIWSSKKYNDKNEIERKISVDINKVGKNFLIRLNYHF